MHTTTQEANLKTLCESVPNLARSRCPQLATQANFINKTFLKVLTKFGKCHAVYDSGKELSEAQIEQLRK